MAAKKLAVLIDGGHLRKCAEKADIKYNPNFIEKIGKRCAAGGEEIFRILYYDCAPFNGTVKLPVSGTDTKFAGSDQWLHDLARRNLFAVRLGVLKFRGWRPKTIPIAARDLTDGDFSPIFEQKGVDMRIGLDIAALAEGRTVDRVAVVGADTDLIPAMKHGRIHGLQVVAVMLPNHKTNWEFLAHIDIQRALEWPIKGRPVNAPAPMPAAAR